MDSIPNPWASLPVAPPFVLPQDEEFVQDFNGRAGPGRLLHVDKILPEPFVGAPDAPVVLLGNNPGFTEKSLPYKQEAAFVARRKAFEQFPDSEEFYRVATRLYREWRSRESVETEGGPESAESEAEKASEITIEQAEEQAWSEVERYLRGMPPYEFQELVASLLRAMGYHVAWVAPPGKDGGIDILAYGDPLGTRPPRIKVQVKRVGQNVTAEGLRAFMAVLGDDDVGLFVTTSGFTKDAKDEAQTRARRQVTLVDLKRFFDLWVKHYDRLEEQARRRFPLKPIYFLALAT